MKQEKDATASLCQMEDTIQQGRKADHITLVNACFPSPAKSSRVGLAASGGGGM